MNEQAMRHDRVRINIVSDMMHSDSALEDALLTLYRQQTADEQASEATTHHNGVGFSAFDARQATYCAKWLLDAQGNRLSSRHLSGRFLQWARRTLPKYAGQLATLALAQEDLYLREERAGIQAS